MKWMEIILPFFPASASVKKGMPGTLAASILLYAAAVVLVRLVFGKLFGAIWLIGGLFRLVSALFTLYGFAGILLSLYEYYNPDTM